MDVIDDDYKSIIASAWNTYLSNDRDHSTTPQFGLLNRHGTRKKREITKMGIDLPIEPGYESHLEETVKVLKLTTLLTK